MSINAESMSTADWQAMDAAHHLHPFTDHKEMHGPGTRVITRAEGIYLYDSDGNEILDAMAGLWCVNLGYGRNELADVARDQMQDLPYYNTFFQSAHPPSIELGKLLADVTPEGLNHVFYCNSGSEANDTVIRMVRHYWSVKDQPERTVIISRQNAYHGSSVGSASLGGMVHMHHQGGLPIPDVAHIDQPYWFDEGYGQDPEEFGLERARQLEQKILEIGPEKVAAFIGEPVQGAGGVIVPPDSYWPEIQRICREYNILLVADEVICGFGRTGNWFGSETYGIKSDLMPIAKGMSSGYLPIGGVMVRDEIADVLINQGGEFFHGYTYSGHPASCAVAIRNIEIMRDEGLVDRVANDTGPYLQQKWKELEQHPMVGETRGVGMLGALELIKPGTSNERVGEMGKTGAICRNHCYANNIVSRAVRDSMVISPPLIIDRSQIDELTERMWRCLDLTQKEVS